MNEDKSSQYGLGQFTSSTWATYGGDASDPAAQTRAGLDYVKARYGEGGYIAGPPITVYLDPDECLIRAADAREMRIRCSRPGHPTATSDCGKPDATIEPPEATA